MTEILGLYGKQMIFNQFLFSYLGLPDNKESIQLGFVGMDGKFPSQEDCPGYEETAKQFQLKSRDLAMLLLGGFATGLGLPQDFFQKVR